MSSWTLKVLFDGQCPFCRLEERWLKSRDKAGRLDFEDISAPEFDAEQYGLLLSDLHASLHGVLADGQVIRGPEVFRQAYRAVGLGWILAPTGWPLLRQLVDFLYALFARHRVSLGRMVGRPCEDGACRAPGRLDD